MRIPIDPAAGLANIAQVFDIWSAQKLTIIGILVLLIMFAAMTYGPIASALVELFPTRIRYSGMSLPYHIGNGWFGGLLPATSFAIVAATGNIYSGLWYPVVRRRGDGGHRRLARAGDAQARRRVHRAQLITLGCGLQRCGNGRQDGRRKVRLVDAKLIAVGAAQPHLAVAGREDERRPEPFRLSAMDADVCPEPRLTSSTATSIGALGDQLRRLLGVVRRADDGAAGLLENVDQNHRDKRLVLEDQHALACQRFRHALFSNGSASSHLKPVLGYSHE